MKRLYRTNRSKVIFGVCSGLGEYFDVDPVLVRLIMIAFACLGGTGLLAYLIAAVVMPVDDGTGVDIQ